MTTPENDEQFIETITSLPKKKRSRGVTLQDLVTKHYVILKDAHERGYSYEELAPFFKESFGRVIKGDTLRKYMSRAKAELTNEGDIEKSPSQKTAELPALPSEKIQPKPSKKALKDRVFSKPNDRIKDKFQDM